MTKKMQSPWASGPAEILIHALGLLKKDSDTNRRLAMMLIDNAVEQMSKTYLSLPKRITGIKIPRKNLQEAFDSFPALLDTLEEHASSKLEGVDLGSIEFYHRIRNQLYHEGIGLTVEREKVDIYAELASVLFRNLFGQPLELPVGDKTELLGQFIEKWNQLENALARSAREIARDAAKGGMHRTRFPDPARFLAEKGFISKPDYNRITQLRQVRNSVVHNEISYNEAITPELLDSLSAVLNSLEFRTAADGEKTEG
jgi:hypothetical protein